MHLNTISQPFTKHACLITSRSKTSIWELANGTSIESKYPPFKNLKIPHNSQIVNISPYKNSSEDITANTKHIIQQNNFINTNLNTIRKQLTRIQKQIQKTLVEATRPVNLKLKNSVFKPYQVTRTS